MKKTLFILTLFIITAILLVSCGNNTNTPSGGGEETQPPETEAPKEYNFGDTTIQALKGKSFYKVFEAPEGDPRQAVVDYMRKMATVEWVATETWTTTWRNAGDYSVNLKYTKGKTYYGLPYSECGADFNSFMEYVKDGKFTPNSHYHEELVGNHCSYSMDRAFEQLVKFPGAGYLKPASTNDRDKLLMFPEGSGIQKPVAGDNWYSEDLIKHNGIDTICEGYALLGPGDILYKHISGSGHTRLTASYPVVVRKANGKIDHKNSYITVIEQTNAWFDKTTQNTTWFVDKKYSFTDLISGAFMPVTLKVYHQENPDIKDAYISYSTTNTAESIKTRTNGTLKTNFAFTYVLATITDQSGNVVSKWTMYKNLEVSTLDMKVLYNALKISSLPAGTYTYNLRAGIARGNCDVETITFTK